MTWNADCRRFSDRLVLELGKGFAFVGSQYHLEVGGKDFYPDLLFCHMRLRCFVVIDLKIEEFQPEFAGKMNFYLSAVDDQLRHADHNLTIGIVLCKGHKDLIVEYAFVTQYARWASPGTAFQGRFLFGYKANDPHPKSLRESFRTWTLSGCGWR